MWASRSPYSYCSPSTSSHAFGSLRPDINPTSRVSSRDHIHIRPENPTIHGVESRHRPAAVTEDKVVQAPVHREDVVFVVGLDTVITIHTLFVKDRGLTCCAATNNDGKVAS